MLVHQEKGIPMGTILNQCSNYSGYINLFQFLCVESDYTLQTKSDNFYFFFF